jgi:DNA-binding winged helix-turn-helix (wHTH) protein/tetratricopeptide (TPR) repeat protein
VTSTTTAFGDVTVDLAGHEIHRAGEPVPVEPQVFEVLAHLIRHRDRLVPKTELLDEVWGDRFVSESALTSRIKAARRAVGDNGRDQRVIRTVHGRGYRFVAPVDEDGAGAALAAGSGLDTVVAAVVAGRGVVAVVAGPPGRARSDALDVVHDEARGAGLAVGRGSAAGFSPLGAVVEALDEVVRAVPAALDQVPAACRIEFEQLATGSGPTTPARAQVAVREVALAATTQGLVLVLHDLDLADRPTLAVVAQLARLSRRHRIGLVISMREPERLDVEPDLVVEVAEATGATDRTPSELPAEVVSALTRVALGASSFDARDFQAASRLEPEAADRVLDVALAAGVVVALGDQFAFADAAHAEQLAAGVAPHRRAVIERETAVALAGLDGDPQRIADHWLAAGDPAAAVPYVVEVVRRLASEHRHLEVIARVEDVLDVADGEARVELLAHQGGSMVATGDPAAARTFRAALASAGPEWGTLLRAGLAQSSILAGDLPGAEDAVAGLEPDGGPFDGAIHLARGMVAFFQGDLEAAEAAADAARDLALAPGAPNRLLDVITLQGMIAHSRGEWFDRLRRELMATRQSPQLAGTVFDSHLCVAEYLLYGPVPYDEVVQLSRDLEANAAASGARRAEAFAACVAGEALLLSGRLEEARVDLERSLTQHRRLEADTGTAHSLQRLAEVELADGDRAEAERLAREALTLARWSPLARHLVQRIYGTLIAAAPDLDAALAVVHEALDAVDPDSRCEYCDVMQTVPTAIAFAEAGRLDEAREQLDRARASAALWHGTAWTAAVAEGEAVIARVEGRADEADALLERAAVLFDRAGQPLDAARCREAVEA